MEESKVYWQGKQWKVTDSGLESENVDYTILKESLGELGTHDEETADWLFHMPQKTWVDYPEFVEAYFMALEIHKGTYEMPSLKALGNGIKKGLKRAYKI